jgi:hypothetical protein
MEVTGGSEKADSAHTDFQRKVEFSAISFREMRSIETRQ